MIQVNDIVRYINPMKDEENLVFKVLSFNEVTKRVIIEVQNLPGFLTGIKPTFLESIENLTNL